jgi:formate dehydrogenase subunit delta
MQDHKLVTMANQIGTFFTSQGESQAVAGTATHLKKFWDPRMRAAIVAHLRAGGEGLRPEVRLAVETLAAEAHDGGAVAAPASRAGKVEKEGEREKASGWFNRLMNRGT